MSQLNTNIIKGVQDNDDVVIKTNNTTRVTIASGGDVSLPTTTCTTLSAPSVSAINTCKAWALFDGTNTSSIFGSFNVSTVTDNSTGDYTINFTTALADVNYAVAGSMDNENTTGTRGPNGIMNTVAHTSGVRILCMYGSTADSNGSSMDSARTSVIVFGN